MGQGEEGSNQLLSSRRRVAEVGKVCVRANSERETQPRLGLTAQTSRDASPARPAVPAKANEMRAPAALCGRPGRTPDDADRPEAREVVCASGLGSRPARSGRTEVGRGD